MSTSYPPNFNLPCHHYLSRITFIQCVQLKSGQLTKPWIFHVRCYL